MIWEDLEKGRVPYMVIEYVTRRWWAPATGTAVCYEIVSLRGFGLEKRGFSPEEWPRRYHGKLVWMPLADRDAALFIERGHLPTLSNRHGRVWDVGGMKSYLNAPAVFSFNELQFSAR